MEIDGTFNGINICNDRDLLFIEDISEMADYRVISTPRIGIQKTPEPWKSKPWRFTLDMLNAG